MNGPPTISPGGVKSPQSGTSPRHLPRLFLIGDSISVQYGPRLETLAVGRYAYDRKRDSAGAPPAIDNLDVPTGANAGNSTMVLRYLRHRRAEAPIHADVMLLNCGLHDIRTHPQTREKAVPLDRYRENLEACVAEVRAMKLRLVWISTTPVIDEIHNTRVQGYERFARDVAAYNAAAAEIMTRSGVPIIDLHAFTLPLVPAAFSDHVHFTPEVQQQQATFIFDELGRLAASAPALFDDYQ